MAGKVGRAGKAGRRRGRGTGGTGRREDKRERTLTAVQATFAALYIRDCFRLSGRRCGAMVSIVFQRIGRRCDADTQHSAGMIAGKIVLRV